MTIIFTNPKGLNTRSITYWWDKKIHTGESYKVKQISFSLFIYTKVVSIILYCFTLIHSFFLRKANIIVNCFNWTCNFLKQKNIFMQFNRESMTTNSVGRLKSEYFRSALDHYRKIQMLPEKSIKIWNWY